jgi:hypothetical protein
MAGMTDQKGSRSGREAQVSTATARPANHAEHQVKPAERKVFAPAASASALPKHPPPPAVGSRPQVMDTEGLPPPKQSIGGRERPRLLHCRQHPFLDRRPPRNTDIPEGMVHVFKQVPTQATLAVNAPKTACTAGPSDNSGNESFGILKPAQPSTDGPIKVPKKVQRQTNCQRLPRHTAEPNEKSGPGVFGVLQPAQTPAERPSMEPRDDTGTTQVLSDTDEEYHRYTGDTTDTDEGDSSDDEFHSRCRAGRKQKPLLQFTENLHSVDDIFATINKVMANDYKFPRFGYFATFTNREETSVPNGGAVLYYDPDKPIFGKALAPNVGTGTADEISPYNPARPFAPPTNTNAPAIATSDVPRVDSPQRADTPHEIQPLEPLLNNPDYADWDYEKLKAYCRKRKISSVLCNTVQELRNTLIRDDTNLCEGNVREYIDYHTRNKHARVVRYYRRKKAKEAAKAQMGASGGGEHAADAEDELEPGDSFEFDIDELVLKTRVAPDIRQQPQEQEQASDDLGAGPAHNVVNNPEEMDWESNAPRAIPLPPPGQHSIGPVASILPGAQPTVPTQDLRPPVAHESRKRSRESSIESIARPITPPPNERNIVGRRLAVRPHIRRQQVVSSDTDDEDAFDTLANLRKERNAPPNQGPLTQEIRKKGTTASPAPPTQEIRKEKNITRTHELRTQEIRKKKKKATPTPASQPQDSTHHRQSPITTARPQPQPQRPSPRRTPAHNAKPRKQHRQHHLPRR